MAFFQRQTYPSTAISTVMTLLFLRTCLTCKAVSIIKAKDLDLITLHVAWGALYSAPQAAHHFGFFLPPFLNCFVDLLYQLTILRFYLLPNLADFPNPKLKISFDVKTVLETMLEC